MVETNTDVDERTAFCPYTQGQTGFRLGSKEGDQWLRRCRTRSEVGLPLPSALSYRAVGRQRSLRNFTVTASHPACHGRATRTPNTAPMNKAVHAPSLPQLKLAFPGHRCHPGGTLDSDAHLHLDETMCLGAGGQPQVSCRHGRCLNTRPSQQKGSDFRFPTAPRAQPRGSRQ